MLITALPKFCSEVCSFFQHRSGNNMSSVKPKISAKSLGEKSQVMRDLEKGLSNKDVAEKYGVPRNTISTWVKNKSKYFAALEQSSNKRKNQEAAITNELATYARAFAKIRIITWHGAARKQSSILTYFN